MTISSLRLLIKNHAIPIPIKAKAATNSRGNHFPVSVTGGLGDVYVVGDSVDGDVVSVGADVAGEVVGEVPVEGDVAGGDVVGEVGMVVVKFFINTMVYSSGS